MEFVSVAAAEGAATAAVADGIRVKVIVGGGVVIHGVGGAGNLLRNAVVVEAVLAELVVALVEGAGVGPQLLAVGIGLTVRGGIGEPSQGAPVVFFKSSVHRRINIMD